MMTNEKLTDTQKEILEDNIKEIRKKITKIIRTRKSFRYLNKYELIDQAIGLSPWVIQEYDSEKSTSKDIVSFIASRCILRLMDEQRSERNMSRLTVQRIKLLKMTKDKIRKQKGYCEKSDLIKELYKNDKKTADKIFKSPKKQIISLDKSFENGQTGYNCLVSNSEPFEVQIDTKELFDHILQKANSVFKDTYPVPNNVNKAHKKIIKEYLIPKAYGAKHKTLKDIAQDLQYSEGRMSQILNGDRMTKFFESINIL